MGILNVTPDSFSDGGRFRTMDAAVAAARAMREAGADIIDVGGESTRPGADDVPQAIELERVVPVVRALAGAGIPVSVDTRKAAVMRAAIAAGAAMINDVSALTADPDSLAVVAASNARVVLMHMRGTPKTMQTLTRYDDVVQEVLDWLDARVGVCVAAGIERARLLIDPGIGFAKARDGNLALLRNLERFRNTGIPVVLGASRKAIIRDVAGEPAAGKRLGGSLALALRGAEAGVAMVRVHDVAGTWQALQLWRATRPERAGATGG